MPELPEVYRATHFLNHYLVQPGVHTLSSVSYYSPPNNQNTATLTNDSKIFETAKTGTDASAFSAALQGKIIKHVGRLGKYFWLEMESPPHPLFHFGMTGWIKYKGSKGKGVDYWDGKTEGRKDAPAGESGEGTISNDKTQIDNNTGNRLHEVPPEDWPPRFTKMLFKAKSEHGDVTDFAFVDSRRFARIALIYPEKDISIRNTPPLALNGPDPVLEADHITPSWLATQTAKRNIPIKTFLLDQHMISGIGNWVADEVLFHAKIHPEATANTLSKPQTEKLVEQIKFVCKTAALEALGDSNYFPDDWLMRHRWRLDKNGNSGVLPSGEKIIKVTVGGRTSAVVPSRQSRATKGETEEGTAEAKTAKRRRSSTLSTMNENEDTVGEPAHSGSHSRRSNTRARQSRMQPNVPGSADKGRDQEARLVPVKDTARKRRR